MSGLKIFTSENTICEFLPFSMFNRCHCYTVKMAVFLHKRKHGQVMSTCMVERPLYPNTFTSGAVKLQVLENASMENLSKNRTLCTDGNVSIENAGTS